MVVRTLSLVPETLSKGYSNLFGFKSKVRIRVRVGIKNLVGILKVKTGG